MTKSKIILLSIVAVVVILLLTVLGTFNGLVGQREQVDTAWSQVETQYQRRYDLIPGLVAATRGNLVQEQEVFGDIAEARTKYAGSAPGSDERVAATGQVESALSRLLVIMENYPQLTSQQTIRALMDELAGTENRVAVARQRYNENVRDYNVRVKTFPTNVIAGMFGFPPEPLFESEVGSEKAPEIDLEVRDEN